MPTWLMLLLASACGLVVANLYYAQPILGPISAALGLSPAAAGLIVTLTQLGYGAGLLLIVPMGDLLENRRLVVSVLGLCTAALVLAALSQSAAPFLLAALCTGLGAVAVQILVPYAAHLAPPEARGRVVGNVMSGLLLGIMLARPASSLVAGWFGWHAIFVASAVATGGMALLLARILPPRRPSPGLRYGALLLSMLRLWGETPMLRRRAAYHACLFAAFSLFWTAVPLVLTGPGFGLSQQGVAIFALIGVAGAVAAPLVGRVADRGWSRPAGPLAMLAVALAFPLGQLGGLGGWPGLVALGGAAILLDAGVAAHLVVAQRAIFSLGEQHRSRLNGLFMAVFFLGGAAGSALGAWSHARGGWPLTAWIGFALPAMALLYALRNRNKD
jgi:predicted MFS family arabinose efflux permease